MLLKIFAAPYVLPSVVLNMKNEFLLRTINFKFMVAALITYLNYCLDRYLVLPVYCRKFGNFIDIIIQQIQIE